MAVRLPTLEQIDDLGSDFGLVLTADEIAAFQQAFKGPLASYGRLDELVPPALAPIAPRSPGYRPAASENPYGAWYWKTNIQTGAEGLLSGKKVAIKDNICVCRRPDDERLGTARRLCSGARCHRRDTYSRCWRHHRRQGRLRGSLLFRGKSYLRRRRDPQPA